MRSVFVALAALVSAAAAVDLRELYTFSGGNGTAFCDTWDRACVDLQVSGALPGLDFQETFCTPGDFQGKNTDTEILAFCAFTADGTTPIPESAIVAAEVGATLA